MVNYQIITVVGRCNNTHSGEEGEDLEGHLACSHGLKRVNGWQCSSLGKQVGKGRSLFSGDAGDMP